MPRQREWSNLNDWEHMMHFAIELISQSKLHKRTGLWGERIIILHLDHALELLMKAFLTKEGFIISYLEKKEISNGIKEEEFLDKSKSMEYLDCLRLVCNYMGNDYFSDEKQKKIMRFHNLRNEIQHRAINIPQNKKNEITIFYPYFKELYTLMFPEFADAFPDFESD